VCFKIRMGEIFEGDSLNGKASILNYKSPRSPSLEKDDWARCIQASIPLSEYDLDTSSVTSSSNWIKAFRTQSRGQEVTIPCVSSQFEEEDHDERVERMLPSFSTSTSMRGPTRVGVGASGTSSHQQRKIDSKVKQHQIYFQNLSQKNPTSDIAAPPASTSAEDLFLAEDEVLSATSVRLVQDYIDLSSAILNPKSYRHITAVTKSDQLRPLTTAGAAKESRAAPLKSQYSGMDKDDDISLIAPKYQPSHAAESLPTLPHSALPLSHDSTAPSLSIISIQSPRSQTQSRPKRIPLELHDSSHRDGGGCGCGDGVSASNSLSLVGIGGEILERDSVYFSAPQSFHSSQVRGNGSGAVNEIPVVTGSSFSPIKTTRRQFPPSQAATASRLAPAAPPSPNRARGREIHMQLPIPSQSIDFSDSLISSPASPPRQQQLEQQPPRQLQQEDSVAPSLNSPHHFQESHCPLQLHNSSVLTKFVTEDTQQILNQYLLHTSRDRHSKPFTRPNTQQRRSSSNTTAVTLRPRAVTPSLEVSWNDELREQQKALRTVFQSSGDGNRGGGQRQQQQQQGSMKMKPQPPFRRPFSSSAAASCGPTRGRSHPSAAASVSSSLRAQGVVRPQWPELEQRQGQRQGQPRGQGQGQDREEIDCDSVSEIQSVLNQMTRPPITAVACENIKPLDRYSNTNTHGNENSSNGHNSGRDKDDRNRSIGGPNGEESERQGEEEGESVLTVEEILNQLDNSLVLNDRDRQSPRSTSASTATAAPLVNPASLISPAIPRLLLKSPRLHVPPSSSSSAAAATQLPTHTQQQSQAQPLTRPRISLPAVNGAAASPGSGDGPSGGYADASPLNSLSIATAAPLPSPVPSPSPSGIDKEARKKMSHRILRTHQTGGIVRRGPK
jgi:hypothetical protein